MEVAWLNGFLSGETDMNSYTICCKQFLQQKIELDVNVVELESAKYMDMVYIE